MLNKITWEGTIGLEFSSFTQKTYDEVLDTDPSSPNYVGTFKEAKEKYFDYLQAKGRGEDVKNPFTIFNLKDRDYSDEYIRAYLGSRDINLMGSNNDIEVEFVPDIKINIDEKYESKLNHSTDQFIKNNIRIGLKAEQTSGSFEFDINKQFQEESKAAIETYKDPFSVYSDCNIYIEPSSKLDKVFIEVTNDKDPNMFISDIIKIDPTLGIAHNYSFNIYLQNMIDAYTCDYDLDEITQKMQYEKENGNFYEGKLLRCTGKDPMNWNFNPEGTIQFSSWLEFKKADLHQTNYYRYCDPDKITFKEFKEKGKTLPVYFLNKDKLQEWKDNTISPTGEMEKNCYPYGASLNIDTYDHNVKLIGEAALYELCDVLASNEALSVNATYDATDNIKYYFDQDFEVFNLKDYGNEIGGSFIYRNLEFEFDYDPQTEEIKLLHFDYSVEDDKTGYYKQIPLPELMKNPAIQEMLIDQIDLQVNTFIAENRYGSLDEMLKAAESKATKGISSRSEKSKDDLEM